jgi:transcriptional regulator with XRE-family HTH domain
VPPRGRPPTPPAPDAPPAAAAIGAKLRALRLERDLTQAALGELVGVSPQHVSEVERARANATATFIYACERALEADGALRALLGAALEEASLLASRRSAARTEMGPVGCCADSDTGDEDVEPTTRLELLEVGAALALGVPVLGAVPKRACQVDPELPAHWAELLTLLGRHAEMFGSRGVLGIVQRELRLIAQHRAAARGALGVELMRVEARWAGFAAWLCHHTDDVRGRTAWTDNALWLAHESDDSDMAAFGRGRQSKHASDARRAVEYAEDALRARGASAQTRAWCARYAAVGHARAGDTASCERRLHDAYALLEDADSSVPPWAHGFRVTSSGTRATEARCWLAMAPAKAIGFYEDALRDWPRAEVQHGGLQRARLALACARAGELDRAETEGAKALAVAKRTGSVTIKRELKRLGSALQAA